MESLRLNLYDIQKTTFKIWDFISWYKDKTLVLSPDFQRRSVWNDNSKSYLMDTIIRWLPMPIIILREKIPSFDDYKRIREVVDWQQRLTTILDFFDKKFKVKQIHNTEYWNLTFDKLPDEIKQRIMNYEISVHVLPSSVSDPQVLEIFSRLNSTWYKLNKQELRNAEYQWEFKNAIYSVSSKFIDYFLKWNLFNNSDITRMKEAEFTTDVFVFMINWKITARKPELFDKKYEEFENKFPLSDNYKEKYINVLNNINIYLWERIKDSIFKKESMFYHLFALFYNHMYIKKLEIDNKYIEKILEVSKKIRKDDVPAEIIKASSKWTNNIDSRNNMFNYLNNYIYGKN